LTIAFLKEFGLGLWLAATIITSFTGVGNLLSCLLNSDEGKLILYNRSQLIREAN